MQRRTDGPTCLLIQVGSKGGRTFIVTCQHGTRSLDRIPGVRQYLSRHAECNAAWEPYLQRPSETDAEHAERLKETFCFLKNFTAFANFPAPVPYSPSKGETVSVWHLCSMPIINAKCPHTSNFG